LEVEVQGVLLMEEARANKASVVVEVALLFGG
jgi:hypothetical protein